MKLRDRRLQNHLTIADCAQALGIAHARNYQRYETGANRADAPVIERILALTEGAVSLRDIHEQRLEWLRDNRPDMLAPPPPFTLGGAAA